MLNPIIIFYDGNQSEAFNLISSFLDKLKTIGYTKFLFDKLNSKITPNNSEAVIKSLIDLCTKYNTFNYEVENKSFEETLNFIVKNISSLNLKEQELNAEIHKKAVVLHQLPSYIGMKNILIELKKKELTFNGIGEAEPGLSYYENKSLPSESKYEDYVIKSRVGLTINIKNTISRPPSSSNVIFLTKEDTDILPNLMVHLKNKKFDPLIFHIHKDKLFHDKYPKYKSKGIFLNTEQLSKEDLHQQFYSFLSNQLLIKPMQIKFLKITRKNWASPLLQTKYYPIFDEYLKTLKDTGQIDPEKISIQKAYQNHSSPSGWQMFSTNHDRIFLMVLNFSDQQQRNDLLHLLDENANESFCITHAKSGNNFSICLYFDVALDIEKTFSKLKENLSNAPKLSF